MHAQLSARALGGLTALRPRTASCSRRPVSVRAAATGPGSRKPKDFAQQVQQQCDVFFQVCTLVNPGSASVAFMMVRGSLALNQAFKFIKPCSCTATRLPRACVAWRDLRVRAHIMLCAKTHSGGNT